MEVRTTVNGAIQYETEYPTGKVEPVGCEVSSLSTPYVQPALDADVVLIAS